jgi:hypothetical protein
MRYWIVVVSKDHVARGIAGGFVQANHGKVAPLKRMTVNDRVICYSPKVSYSGNEALQAFTAIGQVAEGEVYQYKMTDDFIPWRRNINFHAIKPPGAIPFVSGFSKYRNTISN